MERRPRPGLRQRPQECPQTQRQTNGPSGELIDWTGFETPPARSPRPQFSFPPLQRPEDEERARERAEQRALADQYDPYLMDTSSTPRHDQYWYDELLPGDRERRSHFQCPPGDLDVFDPVPLAPPEVVQPFDPIPEPPPRTHAYVDELAPGAIERPGYVGVHFTKSIDVFADTYPLAVEDFDPLWKEPAARTPTKSHFRDLVPEWGMYGGGALIPPPHYQHPDYLVDVTSPEGPRPRPFPYQEASPLKPSSAPVRSPAQEVREGTPPLPPVQEASQPAQAPRTTATAACPPVRPTRRNQFQSSLSFGDPEEPVQRPTSSAASRVPPVRQRTATQPLTDLVDWNTVLPPIIEHPSSLVPQNLYPEVTQQQQQRVGGRDRWGRPQVQRPVNVPDMIQLEEAQVRTGNAAEGVCPMAGPRATKGRNLMQTSINWGDCVPETPTCRPGVGGRSNRSPPQQQQMPEVQRAPRGRNLMQTSIDWGGAVQETPTARPGASGRSGRSPPPQQQCPPERTTAPACPPTQEPAAQRAAKGRNLMQTSINWLGGPQAAAPAPRERSRSPQRQAAEPACPQEQVTPAARVSPAAACPPERTTAPACPPTQEPAAQRAAKGRNLMQTSINWLGGPQAAAPAPRERSRSPQRQAAEPACPQEQVTPAARLSPAAAALQCPPEYSTAPACPPTQVTTVERPPSPVAGDSMVQRATTRRKVMQSNITWLGGPQAAVAAPRERSRSPPRQAPAAAPVSRERPCSPPRQATVTPPPRPPSPAAAVAAEVREVMREGRERVNQAIQSHQRGFVDHSRFF